MKTYLIIMLMLFSLFGCNTYEPIDPSVSNLFVTNKKGKVFYRYVPGGAVSARISELPTQSPDTFRPLSRVFATDNALVFFEDQLIQNADAATFEIIPEFPSLWAKDKNHVYFKQHQLEGFSAKSSIIHNEHFISSQDKVMLILTSLHEGKYFHTYDVPVEDPESFSAINTIDKRVVFPDKVIGKDKYWFYIDTLKLPIPSPNAQVHSVEHPISVASGDNIYLLYNHVTAPEIISERLPSPLSLKSNPDVGSFRHNQYHLFEIGGFNELVSLSEFWLRDSSGLYFLRKGMLTYYSTEEALSYHPDETLENVLQSESGYLICFYRNMELPLIKAYSSEAEFLSNWVVKDQGKVYANGDWIEKVDASSLIKVNQWHYMDKNYYYFDTFAKEPSILPDGAYEKIKSGEASWEEFFLN
jgi:hypothetical protein